MRLRRDCIGYSAVTETDPLFFGSYKGASNLNFWTSGYHRRLHCKPSACRVKYGPVSHFLVQLQVVAHARSRLRHLFQCSRPGLGASFNKTARPLRARLARKLRRLILLGMPICNKLISFCSSREPVGTKDHISQYGMLNRY